MRWRRLSGGSYTPSRGDQKVQLFENLIDRLGRAVIPGHHALGGVAAGDEVEFGVGMRPFQLARDVDQEASFDHLHAIMSAGAAQHLYSILQTCAMKFLVRIGARDDADYFIYFREGGVDQGEMGSRHRVEGAGEDSDFFHRKRFKMAAESAPTVCRMRPSRLTAPI